MMFKVPKICENCGTQVTPVWRKGLQPGARLCNACGLRRKRRIHQVLLEYKPMETVRSTNQRNYFLKLVPALPSTAAIVPPKRRPSSFLQFAKIWRPILSSNQPMLSFGNTSMQLSNLWNTLDEQDKNPYRYLSATLAQSEHGQVLLSKIIPLMENLLDFHGTIMPYTSIWTCCMKDLPASTRSSATGYHNLPALPNCANELFIFDIRKKTKFTDNYYVHYIPL